MKVLFLCVLLFAAFASEAYERNKVTYFSYRAVRMENAFLSLTFAPDQLGRLAVLKLRKNDLELTDVFKLRRYTETPLFYLDSDNFQGVRELFWRQNISGVFPMEIKERSSKAITFETSGYGGSSMGLRRKVFLEKDSLIISFETRLTNRSSRDEKVSVWLNLQGAPPARPVIPVPGSGKVPLRGEMKLYHRPFIFTGAGGNSHLPPGEEWAGFRLPGRKAVWVMECADLKKGGFFYSWGNQDHRAPIRTVEPIFPEMRLKKGASSAPLRYRILVFPGLDNINALAGETALEVRCSGRGTAELLFCNAAPRVKPQKMALTLRDTRGKNVLKKSFLLSACKAGSILSFRERCSGKAVSGTLETGNRKIQVYFEKDK